MLAAVNKMFTLVGVNSYIEFSSSPRRRIAKLSLGNPTHDGRLPSRLVDSPTIRVDGEPIQFMNEEIPQVLLRTLYEMKKLRGEIGINCRRFAALMYGLGYVGILPVSFLQPDEASPVAVNDPSVSEPVVLGTVVDKSSNGGKSFYNQHMAVPAHQVGMPSYLHKLGFNGPVCLSGLQDAMDIYGCTHAYLPKGIVTGALVAAEG